MVYHKIRHPRPFVFHYLALFARPKIVPKRIATYPNALAHRRIPFTQRLVRSSALPPFVRKI